MKKSQFAEAQIAFALRQEDEGRLPQKYVVKHAFQK